ncbi:MAG: WYL domain-containing protein [Gammaproteobacteria bacterium]|nr:WYL domain-containing protein [Gammaproteobacteria bacterium]
MGRSSSGTKINRLGQLIGKLQSGDAMTAGTLAIEMGVSLRTLMRDLEILRDSGYPIEADKGRGGGIRLYSRWGVGRVAFNYREVIDLLLAMEVIEKLKSPMLLYNIDSLKNKLYASFPDTQRPRIWLIRKRILVGELASAQVLKSYNSPKRCQVLDTILESFFDQIQVSISYQREDGEITERVIEVHYLLLNWPIWYLICYDHLRGTHRTFRIDRIGNAKLIRSTFQIRFVEYFSPELMRYSSRL